MQGPAHPLMGLARTFALGPFAVAVVMAMAAVPLDVVSAAEPAALVFDAEDGVASLPFENLAHGRVLRSQRGDEPAHRLRRVVPGPRRLRLRPAPSHPRVPPSTPL